MCGCVCVCVLTLTTALSASWLSLCRVDQTCFTLVASDKANCHRLRRGVHLHTQGQNVVSPTHDTLGVAMNVGQIALHRDTNARRVRWEAGAAASFLPPTRRFAGVRGDETHDAASAKCDATCDTCLLT